MANRTLFQTKGRSLKAANTVNEAGGRAYSFGDEAALAQLVVTGTFNNIFYATAEEQVEQVLQLASKCHTDFIAKAALYAHEVAGMKDTPALLLAILAGRRKTGDALAGILFEHIFPRVITNMKMLMNFVQIIRSGKTGRRSFGTVAKRAIRNWLESRSGNALFTGSIGSSPSFGDILKMTHPKPESEEKKAFYGYSIDRPHDAEALPSKVREFEAFKRGLRDSGPISGASLPVPDVPFQMLSSLSLTQAHWKGIARNMPWNALRMNLNTLARHGVFDDPEMVKLVASRIADPELVQKFNVFPYQLLTTYQNTDGIPVEVRNALQLAMEVACGNIPELGYEVAICIDVSGSMTSAITGQRQGSTSKTRCIDVAALAAAALARKNNVKIVPFDTRVYPTTDINPFDSIMTNATKLAQYGGGGTNCAIALDYLNQTQYRGEMVIYVSDNMSWYNQKSYYNRAVTPMTSEWATYRRRVRNSQLVLIDIQPYSSTQVENQPGVMNIGGFSDKIWPAIQRFLETNDGDFVGLINQVSVD